MSDWITIATFQLPIEAHMARGRLEAEGITCRIVDEHLLGLYPGCAAVLGGVRLTVATTDEARALATLEMDAIPADELEAIALEAPGPRGSTAKPKQPRCPACGTEQTPHGGVFERIRRWLSGTPAHDEGPWTCRACGAQWSDDPRPRPILRVVDSE
ncbi:MAG: DUF2007 domain-containing protein [Bradymonadia bacterium]